MLFVAIHTHTPELCPADSPEKIKKTVDIVASEKHAKKTGVKVLGSYSAPPDHTLFFVLEANDYDCVIDFFRPLMKLGTARIIPVGVLGKVVTKFE